MQGTAVSFRPVYPTYEGRNVPLPCRGGSIVVWTTDKVDFPGGTGTLFAVNASLSSKDPATTPDTTTGTLRPPVSVGGYGVVAEGTASWDKDDSRVEERLASVVVDGVAYLSHPVIGCGPDPRLFLICVLIDLPSCRRPGIQTSPEDIIVGVERRIPPSVKDTCWAVLLHRGVPPRTLLQGTVLHDGALRAWSGIESAFGRVVVESPVNPTRQWLTDAFHVAAGSSFQCKRCADPDERYASIVDSLAVHATAVMTNRILDGRTRIFFRSTHPSV
jgi:hypothetical protein